MKKKRGSHLFPLPIVHRELFCYALFLLEYRAGAPAKDYVHLLAFTFTIRTIRTVDFYETKATTAWGVCVRGGKEAVFTPILGSWRFHCVDQFYPANKKTRPYFVKRPADYEIQATRKKTDTKETQKYIFHYIVSTFTSILSSLVCIVFNLILGATRY